MTSMEWSSIKVADAGLGTTSATAKVLTMNGTNATTTSSQNAAASIELSDSRPIFFSIRRGSSNLPQHLRSLNWHWPPQLL